MQGPEPVSAHDLLVEQHAFLRRLARSLVADPERADDLAQDAALLALRHPPRSSTSPRAWLARILRNRSVSVARSESRRRDREASLPERAPPPTPPELDERYRIQRAVVEAVGRLDEPYRTAVLLRYDRDLSPTAIAEHLGVPVATVKTRLARALERLRRDLDARDEPGTPSWSVVLLAGLNDTRPSVVGAAAAAGGAIVGAKLVVTTVIAAGVLAGTWWTLRGTSTVEGQAALAAAEPVEALAAGSSSGTPAELAAPRIAESRTTPATPDAKGAASEPAWILELAVHGDLEDLAGPARLEVTTDVEARDAVLLQRALAASWTLDLGALFAGDAPRPTHVRVRVDHPDALIAEATVLVPSAWADPEHRGGRLATALTLERASAVVEGVVVHPAGVSVVASLYPLENGRPSSQRVERVRVGASGRFRLRAEQAGPHAVVASVADEHDSRVRVEPADRLRFLEERADRRDEPRLRPATWSGELALAESREIEPLVLDEGLSIEGFVDGEPGVAYEVHASPQGRPLVHFLDSMWLNGCFENDGASARVESDGRFALTGLGPHPCVLTCRPALARRRVPGRGRYVTSDAVRVEVVPPASGVRLQVPPSVTVTFAVTSAGEPVPRADLEIGFEGPPDPFDVCMSAHADDSGLFQLQFDTPDGLDLAVAATGCTSRSLRFEPDELVDGARFEIALEPAAAATATLRVRLAGDVGALDGAEVKLQAYERSTWSPTEFDALLASTLPSLQPIPYRNGWGTAGPDAGAFELIDDARAPGDPWTFTGLRPGSYLVHAVPATPEGAEPLQALAESFVVELAPGDDRTHVWYVRRGGLLRVELVPEDEDTGSAPVVRLLDPTGSALFVTFRVVGRSVSHYAKLESPGAYQVAPALPPGDYTLQVTRAGLVVRTQPVHLRAGATTDVRVDLAQP